MPRLIASSFFEVIRRISEATAIQDVWEIYMGTAREAGLKYGMACFLPDDVSIGKTTFANSYPEHWLQNYVEAGHQDYDPLVRQSHEATAPFSWSLSEFDGLLSPKQLAWRDDNAQAGLHSGIVIPDRSDGALKIISLCGDPGPIDFLNRKLLHFAGVETLLRMRELGLHPSGRDFPALSPRERECLHWIAAGKSDWEVGQILSISEKTVSTHIDRIKHKLGVASRTQALVAALRHGALSP